MIKVGNHSFSFERENVSSSNNILVLFKNIINYNNDKSKLICDIDLENVNAKVYCDIKDHTYSFNIKSNEHPAYLYRAMYDIDKKNIYLNTDIQFWNLENHYFLFIAYFISYSCDPAFSSIDGEAKINNDKIIIDENCLDNKVLFYCKDNNYFLTNFFKNNDFINYYINNYPIEIIKAKNSNEHDAMFNYILANGSRPFWSKKLMVTWVDFCSDLSSRCKITFK